MNSVTQPQARPNPSVPPPSSTLLQRPVQLQLTLIASSVEARANELTLPPPHPASILPRTPTIASVSPHLSTRIERHGLASQGRLTNELTLSHRIRSGWALFRGSP